MKKKNIVSRIIINAVSPFDAVKISMMYDRLTFSMSQKNFETTNYFIAKIEMFHCQLSK